MPWTFYNASGQRLSTSITSVKSVRVYDGSTQSISNNSRTAVAFDTESHDDLTVPMHDTSTNNERLIAKTAGMYLMTASIGFSANATGEREAWINHSADGDIAGASRAGEGDRTNYLTVSTVYDMAADEYVVLQVYQNSGGSLNVNNGVWHHFSLTKIISG
jgi:hypothetical protein